MKDLITATRSLADPTRVRLLGVLRRGPFTVNELVQILAMGQSRVSHHLKILAGAGLVTGRRDGPRVFYSVSRNGRSPGPAQRLLRWLEDELGRHPDPDATAVTACLERRADRSRAFFRRRAGDWEVVRDRIMGSPDGYLPRLLAAVEPGRRVVDLGTGTGILLRHLAPRASTLIGVDASPEMLEQARDQRLGYRMAEVDLRLGTLEHLPLGDEEVDVAVANMVLHHLDHPLAALLEARRVLVPGGRLVVAEITAHDDPDLRAALGGPWPGFEPEMLVSWMNEAGLETEGVELLAPLAAGQSHGSGRPRIFLLRAVRPRKLNGT